MDAKELISKLVERDDIGKLPLPQAAKSYARRSGLKSMIRQPEDFTRVNAMILNPGKQNKWKNYDAAGTTKHAIKGPKGFSTPGKHSAKLVGKSPPHVSEAVLQILGEAGYEPAMKDLIRVGPGGRHAWYNSPYGPIRKRYPPPTTSTPQKKQAPVPAPEPETRQDASRPMREGPAYSGQPVVKGGGGAGTERYGINGAIVFLDQLGNEGMYVKNPAFVETFMSNLSKLTGVKIQRGQDTKNFDYLLQKYGAKAVVKYGNELRIISAGYPKFTRDQRDEIIQHFGNNVVSSNKVAGYWAKTYEETPGTPVDISKVVGDIDLLGTLKKHLVAR